MLRSSGDDQVEGFGVLSNRKGPSTQIIGLQGPKTIQSTDFGTSNPSIWVLGPSGYGMGDGLQGLLYGPLRVCQRDSCPPPHSLPIPCPKPDTLNRSSNGFNIIAAMGLNESFGVSF